MKRTEMKRTAFARADRVEQREVAKLRKTAPARKSTLKARQLSVTAEEKTMWDRLASEIGCIACMIDGQFNPYVSIHHVDGRTKPGCHSLVLPLCAPHHQHDDTDPAGRVGVHPYKARFERRYGPQTELVERCVAMLELTK